MTRFEYWLRAQTQYSIHSPFVFDLYRKVLFAKVSKKLLPKGKRNSYRYRALCYKLSNHFALRTLSTTEMKTEMQGTDDFGRVLVVNHPHQDRITEQEWNRLRNTDPYRVSIDLYSVGVLFSNPHLHRQHFLLR